MVVMRGWVVWLGCAAVFVAGCGPSVAEPITRLATCGTEGPVQLLESGAMVPVSARMGGDRLLTTLRPVEEDEADEQYAGIETWSVGTCGESPVRLAVGLGVRPVGDLLIACDWDDDRRYGDVLRIDPMGQAEPVVLFEEVGCELMVTDEGWLAFNRDKRELWHRADPSRDDSPTRLLATGIVDIEGLHPAYGVYPEPIPEVSGSAIAAVTEDNRLLRYDLADGSSSVVASEAAWGWSTPDGSTLWWREARADDDGDSDTAPVHRRDLHTDADIVVYEGTSPRLGDWPYGLLQLRGAQSNSLLDLRDGTIHALPSPLMTVGTRPNGPVILWGYDHSTFEGVSYVWSEQEQRTIELPRIPMDCPAEWGPEGLDMLQGQDCERRRGDLWSHPYDGSAPRVVAEDVVGWDFLHLDGRVVWSQGEHNVGGFYRIGNLFVTDDEVGRLRLDERAQLMPWPWKDLGGDVVYAVVDGDRSGLWRTATR